MSEKPQPLIRHLLHLDTSAKIQGSRSRRLAAQFVQTWRQKHPQAAYTYRDLGTQTIPVIDQSWVEAYECDAEGRSPQMRQALALSDQLIDELFAADCYVISAPMYNLTIPAALKLYLDQVIRRDRTLNMRNGKPEGALQGKRLLVITTRKFSYRGDAAARNFLEPYVQGIFGVLGLTDISFVLADQLADPELGAASLESAAEALAELALVW
jgi:FMN-dependent NADH-azoreductase